MSVTPASPVRARISRIETARSTDWTVLVVATPSAGSVVAELGVSSRRLLLMAKP